MRRTGRALALLLALCIAPAAAEERPAPLLSAMADAGMDQTSILGQPVYTADGVRHGTVTALVQRRDKVIGAIVRHGGLFGLFTDEAMVPAEQIATVNTDVVVLRWSSGDLAAAPPAETVLAEDRSLRLLPTE